MVNREICKDCKNYFAWSDISVAPDKNGLFIKKTIVNEICCKVNKDIEKIKKCNCYEEAENKKEEIIEEKKEKVIVEEKKEKVKTEKIKKDIKKKKSKFVK